ncbi:hypothetical protein GCM10023331_14740 [Algivirga pacifica]|uniref:SbsA Ig-like domain-containing protein n=2 Tax=Algivirga pacifica TaxID=1162670 RepID=A0ABP9D9E2_9BACT
MVPPKMMLSIPKRGQVNYTDQELILYFDERVQQDQLKQKLIITPYDKDFGYRIKVKKNRVKIVFDSLLQENTTYSLDFQDGIVDVTEKNPASNMFIYFSTGEALDSMNIIGSVIDLYTGKPVQDAIVLLYDANDTLDIEEDYPKYVAKTNSIGMYILDRFKSGNYYVYALKDEDRNYKYSLRHELIGFFEAPIEIQSTISQLKIPIVDYDTRPLSFGKVSKDNKDLLLTFNKGLLNYRVEIQDTPYKDSIFHTMDPKEGIIRLLYTGKEPMSDSIEVMFSVTDSIEQELDSTAFIQFEKVDTSKEEKEEKGSGGFLGLGKGDSKTIKRSLFSFQLKEPTDSRIIQDDSFRVVLDFGTPVTDINYDSIYIFDKSDTLLLDRKITLNHNGTEADLGLFKMDSAFTLWFKEASFISYKGDSSSSNQSSFQVKDEEQYGAIEGEIKGSPTSFFVQLVDNNYQVVQEVYNQKLFRFEYIKPGNYYVRVLIDENGDGIWSKGDFKKRIPPEPIVYYKNGKVLNVIANWEISRDELIIDLDEKENSKKR